MFLGIHGNPPSQPLVDAGISAHEVCPGALNEATRFVTDYVTKSLIFLRKLPF